MGVSEGALWGLSLRGWERDGMLKERGRKRYIGDTFSKH